MNLSFLHRCRRLSSPFGEWEMLTTRLSELTGVTDTANTKNGADWARQVRVLLLPRRWSASELRRRHHYRANTLGTGTGGDALTLTNWALARSTASSSRSTGPAPGLDKGIDGLPQLTPAPHAALEQQQYQKQVLGLSGRRGQPKQFGQQGSKNIFVYPFRLTLRVEPVRCRQLLKGVARSLKLHMDVKTAGSSRSAVGSSGGRQVGLPRGRVRCTTTGCRSRTAARCSASRKSNG